MAITVFVLKFPKSLSSVMYFSMSNFTKSVLCPRTQPRSLYNAPKTPSWLGRGHPSPPLCPSLASCFPVGPQRCGVRRAHQMVNPALLLAHYSLPYSRKDPLYFMQVAWIIHSLLHAKISEVALIGYEPSYSRFFLRFRCHDNGGHPGLNLNDSVKLAVPENHT